MFIERAYAERAHLSDRDLERLLAALRDEEQRYRVVIRNYPPDRMEQHGRPFLARLGERIAVVQRLIEERAGSSI